MITSSNSTFKKKNQSEDKKSKIALHSVFLQVVEKFSVGCIFGLMIVCLIQLVLNPSELKDLSQEVNELKSQLDNEKVLWRRDKIEFQKEIQRIREVLTLLKNRKQKILKNIKQ